MLHTMPFCRKCHTVLNAMLHTMPYCICYVPYNSMLHTLQCYMQDHIAYNAMLHTMSCYVQCHVSQHVMLAAASKELICLHYERLLWNLFIPPCPSSQSLCFTCQKQKKVTGKRKELFTVYLNLNIFRHSVKSTNRPKKRARETRRTRVRVSSLWPQQKLCQVYLKIWKMSLMNSVKSAIISFHFDPRRTRSGRQRLLLDLASKTAFQCKGLFLTWIHWSLWRQIENRPTPL